MYYDDLHHRASPNGPGLLTRIESKLGNYIYGRQLLQQLEFVWGCSDLPQYYYIMYLLS